MSKIEKALEKAVEMREAMQGAVPSGPGPRMDEPQGGPVFETGEAAVDPARVDRHIVCVTDPYSPSAEQYRKLRARVIRDTARDFRNIIMVSSAIGGEGKTITAVNLAVALAHHIDHTVLLVDADLRIPSVHRYLGLNPEYGLSDYLKGAVELPDILIRTGIGKLVFLPAGRPAENPAELLSSERMRLLIRELKERYKDRYVIFDSSPLLVTADTLSLSRHMDGVIFVVQADRTQQKDATKALSLVSGTHILGVVLNNVPEHLSKGMNSYYDDRYAYAGTPAGTNGNGTAKEPPGAP